MAGSGLLNLVLAELLPTGLAAAFDPLLSLRTRPCRRRYLFARRSQLPTRFYRGGGTGLLPTLVA